MTLARLGAELEGLFWQSTAPLRRALRRARRAVALFRRRGEPAVAFDPAPAGSLLEPPARWLELVESPEGLPRDVATTLRLVGDLERLEWIAAPARGVRLVRFPVEGRRGTPPPLGRFVALPGDATTRDDDAAALPWSSLGLHRALDAAPPGLRRRRAARPGAFVDGSGEAGSAERGADDPPAALLLLPFLAVGGAERLLLAYARAVAGRRRLVVVTTEPHRAALGETHTELRRLAEHVPLGETTDRALHGEALAALVRRIAPRSIVSWNGTTLFYERAAALRREFPDVALVQQLYDHRVGWIRRLTPGHRRVLDRSIAVNSPIARALVEERGFPADRVRLVRHGVAAPAAPEPGAREAIRRELGLPEDVVVAASFLRLHPQKRPLDLLAVARRLAGERFRLLLVGGGPMDDAVRAALAAEPAPNVVWRPLDPHPERLFPAADLALLASAYEGLPIFLLEAMARSLPAVATAVGEIPALLAPGGGHVAPAGDPAALADAVRELFDPAVRSRAGAIARETVARDWSLERYVRETDAAIFGDDRRDGAIPETGAR